MLKLACVTEGSGDGGLLHHKDKDSQAHQHGVKETTHPETIGLGSRYTKIKNINLSTLLTPKVEGNSNKYKIIQNERK